MIYQLRSIKIARFLGTKATYRFKLSIAAWFRGSAWVQSYRSEEVIHTQPQREGKE